MALFGNFKICKRILMLFVGYTGLVFIWNFQDSIVELAKTGDFKTSVDFNAYTDVVLSLNESSVDLDLDDTGSTTDNSPHFEMSPGICSYQQRAEFIDETCARHGWNNEDWDLTQAHPSVFVIEKYKLVYCVVSKCGTITYRTLMARLSSGNYSFNQVNNIFQVIGSDYGIRRLKDMSIEEREYVLKEYKKFMVVRHPFDRLRSAYDNKLRKPGILNKKALGKNVKYIDEYFKNLGIERNEKFDPEKEYLTFEQFIDLVGDQYDNGFQDEHWTTIAERCQPCHIKYDFIVRLETTDADNVVLYDYLQGFQNRSLPSMLHSNQGTTGLDPSEKLNHVIETYRDIDESIVSKLSSVYEKDLRLLGYTWNSTSGAKCEVQTADGRACC